MIKLYLRNMRRDCLVMEQDKVLKPFTEALEEFSELYKTYKKSIEQLAQQEMVAEPELYAPIEEWESEVREKTRLIKRINDDFDQVCSEIESVSNVAREISDRYA